MGDTLGDRGERRTLEEIRHPGRMSDLPERGREGLQTGGDPDHVMEDEDLGHAAVGRGIQSGGRPTLVVRPGREQRMVSAWPDPGPQLASVPELIMPDSVEIRESMVFPADVDAAWGALTLGDLTYVSRPWGPIPGIVAVHDEPPDFFDEPGHSRILENSDGSTVVETITALDPPRSVGYTITELTNSFRYLTSGARAQFGFESVDDQTTRITWRYAWNPRNAVSLPLLWIVAHLAFRPYMRRMLERIGETAVLRSRNT